MADIKKEQAATAEGAAEPAAKPKKTATKSAAEKTAVKVAATAAKVAVAAAKVAEAAAMVAETAKDDADAQKAAKAAKPKTTKAKAETAPAAEALAAEKPAAKKPAAKAAVKADAAAAEAAATVDAPEAKKAAAKKPAVKADAAAVDAPAAVKPAEKAKAEPVASAKKEPAAKPKAESAAVVKKEPAEKPAAAVKKTAEPAAKKAPAAKKYSQGGRYRLYARYKEEIVPALAAERGYKNVNQAPKIDKIVLNMRLGDVKDNSKSVQTAIAELGLIAGQKPIVCKAKKSVANFKLREGMTIGAKVTLRGLKAYEFLDKLISVALPRVRDFRGVSGKAFDGRGNYALGVKEQIIFPEISYELVEKIRGFDVAVITTAKTDDEAKALLSKMGMPFRN